MMRVILLILTVLFSITAAQAVEVEERWHRGNTADLAKLQRIVTSTSVVTVNLVWRNEARELYERILSTSEVRRVALVLKGCSLTTNASGDFGKENVVGVLLIQCADEAKTQVQIEVAESGRIFVAFHTATSYDAKRRCFETAESSELVRELIRQPGSRRKETPKLLPPPPRNGVPKD